MLWHIVHRNFSRGGQRRYDRILCCMMNRRREKTLSRAESSRCSGGTERVYRGGGWNDAPTPRKLTRRGHDVTAQH